MGHCGTDRHATNDRGQLRVYFRNLRTTQRNTLINCILRQDVVFCRSNFKKGKDNEKSKHSRENSQSSY